MLICPSTDGDCRRSPWLPGATVTLDGMTWQKPGRCMGPFNDGTMTIDRCNIQDNESFASEFRNEAVVAGGGILNPAR